MDMQQVMWAQQHDWYRDYHHNGTHYVVVVRDDELPQRSRVFDNFKQLRDWAGY